MNSGPKNAPSDLPEQATEAAEHTTDTPQQLAELATETGPVTAGIIFEHSLSDRSIYSRFLRGPDGKPLTGQSTPTESTAEFGGNARDEETIGLAELMDESVAEVRIEGTRNGRAYSMIGKREGLLGSFFAEGGERKGAYLPVFSGFKITVVRRRDPREIEELKKENDSKIKKYLAMPYLQEYREAGKEKEFEAIVRSGVEHSVDPSFLFALRAEARQAGRTFGLYDAGSDTFAGQLVLACHRISQAAKTWTSLGKTLYKSEGIRYSAEFLAFALRSYDVLPGHEDSVPSVEFVTALLGRYDRASGGNLYTPEDTKNALESQVAVPTRNMGRSGDRFKTNDVIARLGGKEGVEKRLVWTNFLNRRVQVNATMAAKLEAAQAAIRANPEADRYARSISSVDGYCWRNKVGGGSMSYHALGMAIDIDPDDNPYIAHGVSDKWNPRFTKIPPSFVEIMKSFGFRWGGDWKEPYDSMHFELPIDDLA
jgi:hypothetical protein